MREQQSVHVRVHFDRDGYWAQVKEWPGCFSTGGTVGELPEALEDAIGLYGMELELHADVPLIRARADSSDGLLSSRSRSRDPDPDWPAPTFTGEESCDGAGAESAGPSGVRWILKGKG